MGNIIVEWYKEILATVLIAFGIVYKFGKHDQKIEIIEKDISEIGEEVNETQGLIEGFHGKCDTVSVTLSKTVTAKELKEHCESSQRKCTTHLCQKIDGIRETQKTAETELKAITIFMATITEQHKTDVILRKSFVERLERISEIQHDMIQEVAILKKSKV